MSDQSKITAAVLPRSGPARSSTNRFSFADLAPTAENAATLPSESSHSGDKPVSTAQELLGPLQGFAAIVAETVDFNKPQHGRAVSLADSEHATSDELWANIPDPTFGNIRKFLTPQTFDELVPNPEFPRFQSAG